MLVIFRCIIEGTFCLPTAEIDAANYYYLTYGLAWLIWIVVFPETCHETKLGDAIKCHNMTKTFSYCVVDRTTAFDICAKTPGCKYVLTTNDAEWNMQFPKAAMLGKDPLSYNSEWKSCELPTTTTTRTCSIHSIPCSQSWIACVCVSVVEYVLIHFFLSLHKL